MSWSTINRPVRSTNEDSSKGYGFITCEDQRTFARILETKGHSLCGRVVEVTKAVGRSNENGNEASKGQRRLFVGGLSSKTTRGRRS